ncbi:MAG: TonB-dependent siderophore receptor [Rhodocyclales bacterium]|nr:TonB-dependent siderophore receptor [Rhodocyclales bacterium]
MPLPIRIKPVTLAVIAACGAIGQLHAADTALPQVNVLDQTERADGPVKGYRATRSSTFTKTDTPLSEIPASVSVIPEALIKDQAMSGMADALRYVPGAHGAQGEGNRDQVMLRGINTTADFFVDGVRDDMQIFRDFYNLERLEVLKGPGGMAFGRGGAGGVINRVVKKPQFGHVGEASIGLGSDSRLRGSVDLGDKANDTTAWRLNAMAENGKSFRNGTDLRRYAVNPTVTVLVSPQTTLTLGFEHARDERTADRGLPSAAATQRPFDTDPASFFGNADQSEARSTVNGFSAVLEHDFAGGTQVKNNFRATNYDKFYQNVYANGAVTAGGLVRIEAYNNADKRTNIFNQTDLTTKFSAGGMEHTLLAGLELGRQDSSSVRKNGFFGAATFLNVAVASPYAVATDFRAAGTTADNAVKVDLAAVYLQDQIALSKEWKLLAGLRYDHFKTSFDDRRTLVAATDLARTDNEWSPRLGLTWSPTANSTWYLSYSTSFLPSAEQLSLATNTAQLAPETAKNYEAGVRWDLLPGLTLSGAVFRTDRDDVKVVDPNNPGLLILAGQQRTDGVELGLQGEVTKNWDIYAGYANLDGRIVKGTTVPAGRRVGLVPQDSLSVWNKFGLGGGWSAGLGVIHQSEVYTSTNNTVKLPAFTRADAALYYAFADGKTRLALNVENLFDRKYYPTAHNDNNISPGAPRNARLTLSTAF